MVDILMGEMESQGSFDSYFVMAKEVGYIFKYFLDICIFSLETIWSFPPAHLIFTRWIIFDI